MNRGMKKVKEKEKAIKLKLFLEDYGEAKGYDRTGFYQQILRKFRDLENDGNHLRENLGVQRSGGLWVGFKSKLGRWLDRTIKPGPMYEVQPIPDDASNRAFLNSDGVYHLKETLKKLEPQIVTYWKVIGAVKRSEKPVEEVGAYLKNGVYVVDMPTFSKWFRKNEP